MAVTLRTKTDVRILHYDICLKTVMSCQGEKIGSAL